MGALTTPSTTRRVRTIATGFAVGCLVLPLPGAAQVVTDGTVGPALALSGPDFAVTADLGEIAGANLFHSFELFSVATGESATFSGPAGLANVISRVTGGERSDIDGLLRSEVPGADFWFLNPAGVMFGPNATLDVPGSFHVSTADELRFADGAVFSATDPVTGSSFTAAAPEAFGYLGAEPAGIVVDQSVLSVLPGEALSLVGGPLDIVGGPESVIRAPAGRITLAALGGPGEVQIETGEVTGDERADISLSELAFIDASGDGGGTVRIRSGNFVAENSIVLANNFGAVDSAGGIDVQGEEVRLSFAVVNSDTFGEGNAGSVTVLADRLSISGGGPDFVTGIASRTVSTGDAGQISVTVHGLLEVLDGGTITSLSFGEGNAGSVSVHADQLTISAESDLIAAISTFTASTGDAGQIFVTVDGLLEVLDNGSISSDTFGEGNAGSVSVHAEELRISGRDSDFFTGISSSAERESTGDSGQVFVTVDGLLEVLDGGEIRSSTFSEGNAGSVTVKADELTISGGDLNRFTGIASSAERESTGNAGQVSVTVDRLLEVLDGGTISSSTFSEGNAGSVTVKAGQLTVSGGDPDLFTGIVSDANPGSIGNAGQVSVIVSNELELRNNGTIRSRTRGQGAGGSVTIHAADIFLDNGFIGTDTESEHETADAGTVFVEAAGRIEFVNEGRIFNGTGGAGDGGDITVIADTFLADATPLDHDPAFHTGVSASVNPGATGEGGDVIVIARVIRLTDGGEISSDTDGLGPGGNVVVIASEELSLTGVAEELDQTGRPARIFASSGDVNADAPAGTVLVAAPVITVADGGQIASSSAGGGEAGTISIGDAAEGSTIEIDRGGEAVQIAIPTVDILRLTDGSITAETARADAGDILINVNQLVDAVDSEITTSAAGGEGGGGNILISAPRFVVLDDSRIVANAFEGRGGNIDITTDNLFRSPDSVIDASSQLGLPGAVTIDAPDVDVTGGLVTLPAGFLDASSLLPESCAARGGEQGGSFVGVGRGGVAPGPETSLPAFYTSPSETVPASADGASAAWKGDALALFSGGWGLDCDSEG